MSDHNSASPVAVVGATGQQGGATARALLRRGLPVRALVRAPDSERARALASLGAELVTADLDDGAGLRGALTGVRSVFVMTTMTGEGGTEAEVRLGVNVLDAAAAAEVPFVLYSSVGGAERHSGVPHFESKRRVEEHLAGLDVASSLLRPTFFMDNLAQFFRPRRRGDRTVVALPLPDGVPLQLVSVRDIGAAAAAILADPDAAPASLEIVGDERTGSGLADAFAEVLGGPARYETLPLDDLEDDMRAMFVWLAETSAYRGDAEGTRVLVPDVLDVPAWLRTTGLTPGDGTAR